MAEKIPIPENVSLKRAFEEILPRQFKINLAENPPSRELEGTEFSMQFDIEGPNGGTWTVIIKDGKNMEVKPGAYDKAVITMKMLESVWRDSVSGKGAPPINLNRQLSGDNAKSNLDALKGIHGKLITHIKKADGSIDSSTMIFNKAESPETTFRLPMEDYIAMSEGKLDAQEAFMSGRFLIEGDMIFAMQLSALHM